MPWIAPILLAALSLPASAVEPDALYQLAFGGQMPAGTVALPTSVDGVPAGDAMVRMAESDLPEAGAIHIASLLRLLSGSLEDAEGALEGLGEPDPWVTVELLAAAGVRARLDPGRLELLLEVDPALRPRHIQQIDGLPPEARDAQGSARVSGFLTAQGFGTFPWDGPGKEPYETGVDLTSAVRVRGLVVEGGVRNTTAQTGPTRLYTRAVYDDVDHAVRYTVGDVVAPWVGLQDAVPMMGASVARNLALQPYSSFRPTGRYTFQLDRRSLVRIRVNDALVASLWLEAGVHDVRTLLLANASNRIEIEVDDGSGTTRRESFSTAASAELLGRGVHQYAYNAGFLPSTDPSRPDWGAPVASGAHAFGLTDRLTARVHATVAERDAVGAVGAAWATRAGNLSVDVGGGRNGVEWLPGARFAYDIARIRGTSNVVRSLGLQVEHRPGQLGRFLHDGPDVASTHGSLSLLQALGPDARASLDLGTAAGGPVSWRAPEASARVGLSGTVNHRVGVGAYAAHALHPAAEPEWLAGIAVNGRLAGRAQTVRGTFDTSSATGAIETLAWSQTGISPGPRLGVDANLTQAGETQALTAHAVATTPRGNVGVSHSFGGERWSPDPTSHVTDVAAAASIAFADGLWALSGPVQGSFAIVGRKDQMRGRVVDVNPRDGQAAARADALGAAVVPNLVPYMATSIRVDADLPLGTELGPTRYEVLPAYMGGVAIRVGTPQTATVMGTLLQPDGTPLAFASGLVTPVGAPASEGVPWFTNGSGRYFVEGLTPGQYELRPFDNNDAVLILEVPADATGLYRAPPLTRSVAAQAPSTWRASPDAQVAAPQPERAPKAASSVERGDPRSAHPSAAPQVRPPDTLGVEEPEADPIQDSRSEPQEAERTCGCTGPRGRWMALLMLPLLLVRFRSRRPAGNRSPPT